MNDQQVSMIPVLKFPEISSGDWPVPTAQGTWMDTRSNSNSQRVPCPAPLPCTTKRLSESSDFPSLAASAKSATVPQGFEALSNKDKLHKAIQLSVSTNPSPVLST